MAFLDKLIEENKFCCFVSEKGIKCSVNVQNIGHNCKFCTGRFCLKHNLPEEHGCEEAAKKAAKE